MWVYLKEGGRVISPALLLSGPELGILILSLRNDYISLNPKEGKKVGQKKPEQTGSDYFLHHYEATCGFC